MLVKKMKFLNKNLIESQILFIYRFISLLITSIFYFSSHSEHQIGKKVFIIGCISISAMILSYLYLRFEHSKGNIIILLLIETIANSILIIPSGGVNSPFIWYSLNTILISAIFLSSLFCWGNFLMYLCNFYLFTYLFSRKSINLAKLIKDESNLLLSFIMIIVAIQGWSIFLQKVKEKNRRLEEVNAELELAYEMVFESMNHINALYQTVNIFTNQGNKEGLINVLFDHIRVVTKSDILFYLESSEDSNERVFYGYDQLEEVIEERVMEDLDNILAMQEPQEIDICGYKLIIMTVKMSQIVYGILGVELSNDKACGSYKTKVHELKFLSELIAVAFERLSIEEMNHRLLITEEQNRIANELHDSVLQRLFSMSCGVFTMIEQLDSYSKEDIRKELNFFRETTSSVMKELRDKIYGLSWKKTGHNSFIVDVRGYIDDLKKMSTVSIPLSIDGNDELLSYKQKKGLYRMICEGVGNSFKHGKADNIDVILTIEPIHTVLKIIDDGIGFDLIKVRQEKSKGIGIKNLYQLTESLHGQIDIQTDPGKGTSIEITLPNHIETKKGAKEI